jgi:hypothetical protein
MDTGVVIMVPYDQIAYMNFVRKMLDDEVNEVFKNYKAPPAPQAAVPFSASQSSRPLREEEFRPISFSSRKEATEQHAESEEHEEQTGTSGKASAKSKPMSKTMMLARLRARLSADQEKGPSPE